VDICDYNYINHTYDYFINSGRIDEWIYSTPESEKTISSNFTGGD